MIENTRTAQVLQSDDTYVTMSPIDLKEGMVFKLFEADGTPVIGLYSDLFLALNDAHLDENGALLVDVQMLGESQEEHFVDYGEIPEKEE